MEIYSTRPWFPFTKPEDRGLMEVRVSGRAPRAFVTEAGLIALRQLVLDRRAMDPA